MSLMLDFLSPSRSHKLTFDDDGKVAYAYLKSEGLIVGDVWLYNRGEAPKEPEWSDPANIPFANYERDVTEGGKLGKEVRREDVLVSWEQEDGKSVAYIYIFENLYGVVGVGDQPGYARLAARDNRLARVMRLQD